MCHILNLPRPSYYYTAVELVSELELEKSITVTFFDNKARYGARKIKKVLETNLSPADSSHHETTQASFCLSKSKLQAAL